MNNEIKLTLENGNIINTYRGILVRDILKMLRNEADVIALRVNGSAVSADFEINDDADIKFVNISDRIGAKIYMKGLCYVYIKAIKDLFGNKASVNIKHSLDRAIYTEIDVNKPIDKSIVNSIKDRMKSLILMDLPIKKIDVSRKDAIEYVKAKKESEKVLNYTYMTSDTVTMYELEDEYNYFYYLMPASTGILNRFDLTYNGDNGIILSYPVDNVVPKYNPSPLVLDAFKIYEEKLSNLGVKYASDINKIVSDGEISDYIHINEIIYDDNMNRIAQKVYDNKSIKAIFISGPSSSGKTTTSKKLSMYLKSKGIDSLVVSTDDYYLERVDSPRKADGSYEYEIVDALDIKLFNMHMKSLLEGKEIIMPTFNFITGEKEYKKKPISLKKNQVLIVEGLHAINERLSESINKKNKLKLYISPFTPLALDRHNHISTTDLRLLRRMVRDYKTRGYSASQTLSSWLGMRKSESSYVYPYQRQADIIINTSLSYEIGVLRSYAEPLLYSVSNSDPCYEEAIRILNFLRGFFPIPSEYVPITSVLREFIGNSYFE